MINSIKNIYKSEDLHGEFLLQPLKMYHGFFAKKIANSVRLKKSAWVVANIVSGIFAYPVFGLLAGIGILVKLTGISDIIKHNQSEKSDLERIRIGVNCSRGFINHSSHSIFQSGWQMNVVKEFKITKQNVETLFASLNQEIDSFSKQFIKIYISSHGNVNHDDDEMVVQLRVRERV